MGIGFAYMAWRKATNIPPSGQLSRTTDGNSEQYHYNSFGKISERTTDLVYCKAKRRQIVKIVWRRFINFKYSTRTIA